MNGSVQYPLSDSMGFGQTLERVFRLTRANLRLFVAIALVPPVVLYGMLAASLLIAFLSMPHISKTASSAEILRIAAFLVTALVAAVCIHWMVFGVYSAASSYAAVRADRGITSTVRESYAAAWINAGRYIWLLILIYLICFLPPFLVQMAMVAGMAAMAFHNIQPQPFAVLLFPFLSTLQIGLFFAGCFFALRFSLAFPAAVFEDLNASQALKRSSVLTRGAKGRIALLLLVIYAALYLAMLIAFSGIAMLVGIGFLAWSSMHLHPSTPVLAALVLLGILVFFTLMALFMAITWAAYSASFAIVYNEQRFRLDGISSAIPVGAPV